jgi:type II secretory pathway component GspD/PulD (secretin)
LGRVRTLTVFLIFGAWGATTEGAALDDAATSPATAARRPAPVPPIKYLEAGAKLFNSGQFELAAKYLDAAQMYRDQLEVDEQSTLEAYLQELAKVQAATSGRGPVSSPSPAASARSGNLAPGGDERPVAADAKQKARWLLHEAREQLALGNFDEADRKVAEAEALDVKWGLFDDTPAKVRNDLIKERPQTVAAAKSEGSKLGDRKTAKARLREARAALANHQYDQAEAIAAEVKSWGLTYSIFDDNPDKVAAAARALRRRDRIRNTASKEQPSQGVYDLLVQESRQLLQLNRLDEAEAKARKAQAMNVVPGLTADRAEAVLHDIAMARARASQKAPAETPATELASVAAEREANELLAKGDQARAAAKFAEAERLRLEESRGLHSRTGNSGSPHDPEVQRSSTASAVASQTGRSAEPGSARSELDLGGDELPAVAVDLTPPGDPPLTSAPASEQRGQQLLREAKALYTSGNYPAARQMAEEAGQADPSVQDEADELLAQIGLAEQGGALSLYESALAAMRAGEISRARALLTEVAAAASALDDSLRTKVQELLQRLPAEETSDLPKGRATVGDRSSFMPDLEALAAQKLNAEVGTKIAEARRLQETDPDKAIAIYEQTMKGVKASNLSPNLMRPMVRRLEVALELAKKDKVAFEAKMQDKKQRAEIELKRLRILEADKAKKARMKELMDKATAAYAEGNLMEAEAYAKRAAEVDPNEVAAIMMVFKAKTERRYKQDLETRAAKEQGATTAFQEIDLASVADPEVQLNGIKFAKNFKDLTRERLRMNARLEPRRDPKVLAIESKLKDPISLNVEKQPLSDAITFLQNYTGMNIVLDPKALSDEGLTSSSPVSLTVNNVQLKTALKLLLRPLGLTYKVEDEVLLITSPQASSAQTFPKTYYVGDLIMPAGRAASDPLKPPTLNPPTSPLGSDPNAAVQAAAMNAGGQNLGPNGLAGLGKTEGERPQVDMTPLIQLITTSIAPGTWSVQDSSGQDISSAYGLGGGFGGGGGGLDAQTRPPGAIIPFFLSISLIIRHTAEVHEQVADLLRQLRRLQDLQVSIEVRFISVSDNFFEQIGIDFDFSIQSDAVGKHSTFAVPNPAAQIIGVPGTPGGVGGVGGGGVGGGGVGGVGGGGVGGGGVGGGGVGGGGVGGGGLGGGGIGGGGIGGGGIGGGGIGGGGLGGGGLGGGGLGGGGLGGGGLGGGGIGGGGIGGGGQIAPYLVNPIRDHALPSRLPVVVGTQGGGLYNFSPNLQIPFVNTSAALIAPSNAIPGAGATFGLAFLSDLEVYFFLTAAQGDTRTNILQAPKVTTFNGAAATIFNNQVTNYVASLLPIVGPGSVAFFPQVTQFPSGVTLFVTPVVSADRRYVRMTLSPFFLALDGFDTIQVPAAVGGAGLGGGAASVNGTIQLPRFNQTTVVTTVTVPDGGTVLLGGVKRLNEERREFGVPVLSKTPWIDRLFRNVGIGRVSTSLMLMVTPRIIILEEEEERLGIPTTAL